MNNKQRAVLNAIFTDPIKSSISWMDIESLLIALGSEKKEGAGSRVAFCLNSIDLIIHRPHQRKEACKGVVKSVRKFLTHAGIKK